MSEFRIGSPADPAAVVDREAETSDLVSKMLSRKINYNIAIVGHRRIGKTTILRKAMHELAGRNNVAVAYFDVRENLTEPRRFFESLERAILDAYSPEHKFLTLLRASIRRRCNKKRVENICS